jgi:hypothetical protein
MHTTPSKPVNPESLHDGYEVTDAKVSIILVALALTGLLGAVAFPIVLWVIMNWDQSREAYNLTERSPLAQPLDQVPPTPHLQQFPRVEADNYLHASSAQLGSYGVVADTGTLKIAHMPIDKAIEAVAEGRVPYRQKPVASAMAPAAAVAAPAGAVTQ